MSADKELKNFICAELLIVERGIGELPECIGGTSSILKRKAVGAISYKGRGRTLTQTALP